MSVVWDWGYVTIIALFIVATVGYGLRDGSDPWSAAGMIAFLILAGKAWVWCFGRG